jgi:hypothetical protein
MDRAIAESTEFVCEKWGVGNASVSWYAPVTRADGVTWVHPTWAREASWEEITKRATRIWKVTGSLWNPSGFRLVWQALEPLPVAAVPSRNGVRFVNFRREKGEERPAA